MKTSAMFYAAKRKLWNGTGKTSGRVYICHAITSTLSQREASHAKGIVMSRLSGAVTLDTWLITHAGIQVDDMTPARMQAHRHAWLDLLIAEFQAKGD